MKKISVVFFSVLIWFIAKDAFCDLRFQGNLALSDRELLSVLDPKSGADSISDQIKKIYRNLAYFDIEVEREYLDRSQNRVFVISEGKQSKISAIDLDIAPDSLEFWMT